MKMKGLSIQSSILLLLVVAIGCENSPSTPDDENDQRTDTTKTAETIVGNEYSIAVFTDIEDNSFGEDRRDTFSVKVGSISPTYKGKSDVAHYAMPAQFGVGFITDAVFHGEIVFDPSGDQFVYYRGVPSKSLRTWWLEGWITYPYGSGQRVSQTVIDSTDPSGTFRQKMTWTAERIGDNNVTVKGKLFAGSVLEWEMEVEQWKNNVSEIVFSRSGEDIFVEDLGFAPKRTTYIYVNDELVETTTATLIDHNID